MHRLQLYITLQYSLDPKRTLAHAQATVILSRYNAHLTQNVPCSSLSVIPPNTTSQSHSLLARVSRHSLLAPCSSHSLPCTSSQPLHVQPPGPLCSTCPAEPFVQMTLLPCHMHCVHMCMVGQNRTYTPYMTVYLVISLPKIPYIHCVYMVLANPTHVPTLYR